MRIMTSNIWGDYFENPPAGRDENLLSVYEAYAPDVIGFQEVTRAWYESALFERLSEKYYFIGTECIGSDNYVPMAVRKEYTLVAKGFEYLEGTPDSSKAITWCVVKRDGRTTAFCNTHFWWRHAAVTLPADENGVVVSFTYEGNCKMRADNARQLSALMKQIAARYACPVFAFGDMNGTVAEEMFEVYRQNGIAHLADLAEERDTVGSLHGNPVRGEDGRYHGDRMTPATRARLQQVFRLPGQLEGDWQLSIDHIMGLGEGVRVRQYRVIEDAAALDATDHSPVYADVSFA